MQDQKNIALLIAIGCMVMFILVIVIIMFVVIYQRKMLLKEAKIQLMEQEKQIALFKASVEIEEQQKEKIARNLHDEINPILTLLKFNLSKHRIEIKKNKFEPDSLIVDNDLLDQAIEGIRTTCLELIPTFLLQYGLLKSLEDHIRNLQQARNITAEFENLTEPADLENFEKQAQLNIYRMCLEILNNMTKHSDSTDFKLIVSRINNLLVFEFKHNGKIITNEEMDVFTENSTGLGLKSLKARALILNSKIEYITLNNQASVKLSIPI
jgi:two-component system NarL family sensor kinase